MITPSIGRTVHFVARNGAHVPALITAVLGETPTEDTPVTLSVFTGDKKNPVRVEEEVSQAQANKKPGTWHEAERV